MSDQQIFNDSYISIVFHEEGQYVHADWIGFQTKQSVMDGCERIIEAMQHFECSRVLNDNTHVEGIWSAAAEWVGSDWFPRLRQAGMLKFAWVYSPSMFSRLSTDKSLRFTYDTTGIEVFENLEEAKQWLAPVSA
ncbi:hypothetical protein ACD591_12160 [Rufibacter glacialis]|uniref:STAS/SEC14 domain-containing protein n=1 Tax=Rufibacter glacialis TaxID=1259555 RepID=A0A5M8QPR5_9BACT|nr:hypothetical protein [Rufibacter glacialis]KAA6437278.1 hypothetical protein FOE74_01910 [Rufibacter glacialis]GGK60469.1 hypothetical protein GCM10011405_05900 [Rufibacter glacialis]